MAPEAPPCRLCRQPGRVLYQGMRDLACGSPGEFALRACAACEFAWLEAPAGAEAYDAAYYTHALDAAELRAAATPSGPERHALAVTLGYAPAADGAGGRSRLLAAVPAWRERCASLALFLPARPGGRLLDVGCGNGVHAARMRHLGWRVQGVEPDAAAAALARAVFALDVHVGTLETAGFEAASFDAITLNHVLEHVPDPVGTLAECARLLRPGGSLVVLTPNIQSLGRLRFGRNWMHWDVPRHICLFSPRSLVAAAQRAGLEPRVARTTARAARWSWERSTDFAAGRVGPRPGPQRSRSATAIAFEAVESLTRRGEECLLLATVSG